MSLTYQVFFTNTTMILVVMGILSCVEAFFPYFAREEAARGRRLANLGLMFITFLLYWGMSSLAALVRPMPMDVLGALRLPKWGEMLVTFFVLDAATYFAHYTMHRVPFMWRAHSVHHSDPFLDVTTAYRQHPLEGGWRFMFLVVPMLTLSLSPSGFFFWRVFTTFFALSEHINFSVGTRLDRALGTILITPNMHKIHHSTVEADHDKNFGNVFAVFDWMFGTYKKSYRDFAGHYGLDTVDPAVSKSLLRLLVLPLRGDTDKPGRMAA